MHARTQRTEGSTPTWLSLWFNEIWIKSYNLAYKENIKILLICVVCVSSARPESHLFHLATLCGDPQHRVFIRFKALRSSCPRWKQEARAACSLTRLCMSTLGPASGLIRHTEQASSQLVLVKAPLWWEETSPCLQPGRLQPADVAWWENSKYLNTQEGFWWVGADLAVLMFYRTDLKSRIHFNLFWDLCCVTLALKEFFLSISCGKCGFPQSHGTLQSLCTS